MLGRIGGLLELALNFGSTSPRVSSQNRISLFNKETGYGRVFSCCKGARFGWKSLLPPAAGEILNSCFDIHSGSRAGLNMQYVL
jgi:hypothetical protein